MIRGTHVHGQRTSHNPFKKSGYGPVHMHMQLRRMILRYYILWPIIIMSILTSMIIQLVLKTTRVFSLVLKLLGHNNSALAHNAHAFISAVCTIPSFLAAPPQNRRGHCLSGILISPAPLLAGQQLLNKFSG